MPEMFPLRSSNLAAAGIDGEDLIVEFRNGGRYRYAGAAGHLAALRDAPSPGGYFASYLKGEPFIREN